MTRSAMILNGLPILGNQRTSGSKMKVQTPLFNLSSIGHRVLLSPRLILGRTISHNFIQTGQSVTDETGQEIDSLIKQPSG